MPADERNYTRFAVKLYENDNSTKCKFSVFKWCFVAIYKKNLEETLRTLLMLTIMFNIKDKIIKIFKKTELC